MIDPERTVLWSAASPASNNTAITLSDSIDNYDEIVYYGSGNRGWPVAVNTEYPVISGAVNGGGPFFYGRWGSGDNYILCNGTQVFLSGNSGYVHSSYFWGKNNGNTVFTGALRVSNYHGDIRPYKIVGVKYSTSDDRTLLWSSTGNPYNMTVTLSESVTGFEKIMVYGSGRQGSIDYHLSKQVYPTNSGLFGCDTWGYTPWNRAYRCNYVEGCELRINGTAAYIGSAYYMGLNQTSTAWAAGKWTGNDATGMITPYRIYGINRK